MIIEFNDEEWEVPMRKGICPSCDGHGRHIHDAFREEAFTVYDAERQGVDFEEEVYAMQSGAYDVKCSQCRGRGMVNTPDFRVMTDEQAQAVEEWLADEAEFEAISRAERAMGA